MRVLEEYFAGAGEVTAANAWEHVYRCLLWMNVGAGLAHIYDSNHMQARGVFHARAVRFTELLCKRWNISQKELPASIDILFKGCIAELKRRNEESGVINSETESELISDIQTQLRNEGIAEDRALPLARKIELLSRDFFTGGNQRKNALGEGFEDLLLILLQRVSHIPLSKLPLRMAVSGLPGFRRAPQRKKGERKREPHPDIAIVEGEITHVITTAKWSMRQDRETQFQSEYNSFQKNLTQNTELTYALITNEFDIARLKNVVKAEPDRDRGGYIFHNVYHICLPLLRETHGERFKEIEPWVGTGKLQSLDDFLVEMRGRFGEE